LTAGEHGPDPRAYVLKSAAAKAVVAAIAAKRKVAALCVDGSLSDLLSHRYDARTGTLALTFARTRPSAGSTPCALLHVTIDGERI
jgi:hypothetical protein